MGFYQDQILPRVQNKVMDRKDLREVRAASVPHCPTTSSRSASAPASTPRTTPIPCTRSPPLSPRPCNAAWRESQSCLGSTLSECEHLEHLHRPRPLRL